MGIPAFFRKIIKEYEGAHFWRKLDIDHLYFDFNCLIYHVLRGGVPPYKGGGDGADGGVPLATDQEVIKATVAYLRHIVELIAPRLSVYVALDGPAPRAKMVQQRARRFKRIIDQGVRKAFGEEGATRKGEHRSAEDKEAGWDSRKISPGTVFMADLARAIKKEMKRWESIPTRHFSTSNVAGEGEHKCIASIRRLPADETVALYGLDADLIVLGMSLGRRGVFILREPLDSDIERALYADCEFLYLSIDAIREGFLESLRAEGVERDPDRVFFDYTFITFLGGNDFVRPITWLNVKEGGLTIMLNVYRDLLADADDHLVELDPLRINEPFFFQFISALADEELGRLKKRQKGIERVIAGGGHDDDRLKRERTMTPLQVAISRFEHLPFYHPDHPFQRAYLPLFRLIDYSKPDWQEKYYEHFFGPGYKVDQVVADYLKSLVYTLHYYFDNQPPSWDWFYPHRVAPLAGDLVRVLAGTHSTSSALASHLEISPEFEEGEPYSPLCQLSMILPPDGAYLLPPALAELASGPEAFELDALAGGKYIYSEPLLPELDEAEHRANYLRLSARLNAKEKARGRLMVE